MGCDGIWEKKTNEQAVEWVYEQIKKQKEDRSMTNDDVSKLDIAKIVEDLLLDNIATDVNSSGKFYFNSAKLYCRWSWLR